MKYVILSLCTTLGVWASGLDTGIRIQDGSSSTNSKSSKVTISALTNINTGSLVLSNTVSKLLKTDAGGAVGGATSGTDYAPATSGTAILKGSGSGGFSNASAGTDYAPATSGSSILKGNGAGGFSNAASGTDYAPATSGSAILKGNGSGGFSSAVAGTDYQIPLSTISAASQTVFDSSQVSVTWTFGLSGATDPTLTAANALLTFNTPIDVVVGTADATALKVRGGSVTGSGTTTLFDLSGTFNTSAGPTLLRAYATNTASSGALLFDLGTGTSSSQFKVSMAGAVTTVSVDAPSFARSGQLIVSDGATTSRARITATADGVVVLNNAASSAFTSLSLGPNDSSPNAATLKTPDGVGTDIAGGKLQLQGGASTGTGRGGAVSIQTTPSATTGSSANAVQDRFYASPKAVVLTESTATTIASVNIASGKIAGATLTVTITANDGTDFQSLTSQVRIDGVNKAGTVTAQATQTDNTAAVSTGTLSCTYTAVANGNNVDIKANAVSSLTQTTLNAAFVVTALNSDGSAVVTPQ